MDTHLPWLARRGRRRAVAFWGGLAASTAALLWMLSVPHEPADVLRIQLLAPTRARAAEVLADWRPLELADDIHWRDYAYLGTFWLPLMAAAGWAADRYAARGHTAAALRGRTVAWLALGVSALDAVENAFTLRQVALVQRDAAAYATDGPAYLAPLATAAACAKWLLVLLVLAYVVRALLARRRYRASTTAS